MNELNIILNNYEIEEKLIRLKYENAIPPLSFLYCTDKCKINEYIEQVKELSKKTSQELQKIEKQKTEAIKEYYEKLYKKVSNMSDRKLLEEVYKSF